MTKGQLESKISCQMTMLQQKQLGRGAEGAKTKIVEDMVIVRLKNVFTPAEKQLLQSEHGKSLIKEIRDELEKLIRPQMEQLIQELTGAEVISIHNDISTKTGERIDIFILNCNLEEKMF